MPFRKENLDAGCGVLVDQAGYLEAAGTFESRVDDYFVTSGIQLLGPDGPPSAPKPAQLLAFQLGLAQGLSVESSRLRIAPVPDDAPWGVPPPPPASATAAATTPPLSPLPPPPAGRRRARLLDPADGPVVYTVVSGFGSDQIPVPAVAESVRTRRRSHTTGALMSESDTCLRRLQLQVARELLSPRSSLLLLWRRRCPRLSSLRVRSRLRSVMRTCLCQVSLWCTGRCAFTHCIRPAMQPP